MQRTLCKFVLFGSLLAIPAWAAQQNPPPGSPAPPAPKAQDKPKPADDEDNAAIPPVSADEDINVGMYYLHKGDIDAAIPRFEDAIRVKPTLAKPRLLLAEAYERKGDKPTAVKYYKEYLQAFPKAPDAKRIQARIEKLSGG
jgi:tetratricopeptide (TPR) repeat protein